MVHTEILGFGDYDEAVSMLNDAPCWVMETQEPPSAVAGSLLFLTISEGPRKKEANASGCSWPAYVLETNGHGKRRRTRRRRKRIKRRK